MDLTAVPWIINVLLGIAMYFLKATHTEIKNQIRENRDEISKVREQAVKKEDFKEFKDELWNRLDRFEDSVKTQIRNQ